VSGSEASDTAIREPPGATGSVGSVPGSVVPGSVGLPLSVGFVSTGFVVPLQATIVSAIANTSSSARNFFIVFFPFLSFALKKLYFQNMQRLSPAHLKAI
jgi:hypothetical protein